MGQASPRRQGRGIAVHRSFLTYVASVVQVAARPDGRCRFRAWILRSTRDSLRTPNVRWPRSKAQRSWDSATLSSEITFAAGRAEQSNFDGYQVMRMDESPREMHVHLVPSAARPAGIGEPGVPPTAPALCNAIFAATGQRIRTLPIGTQLTRTVAVRT